MQIVATGGQRGRVIAVTLVLAAGLLALGPWITYQDEAIEVFEEIPPTVTTVRGVAGPGWIVLAATVAAAGLIAVAPGGRVGHGLALGLLGIALLVESFYIPELWGLVSPAGGVFRSTVSYHWGLLGSLVALVAATIAVVSASYERETA